jgi:hypothetical protein
MPRAHVESDTVNLDSAVQELADLIGRPIIVFDADFGVTAFSVHGGDVQGARLSMILSRKASDDAVQRITDHRVHESHDAVVIPATPGHPERIVAALWHEGVVTGYASYPPADAGGQEDGEVPGVRAAQRRIAKLLADRAAALRDEAAIPTRVLTDLIRGDEGLRRNAAEELYRSGLIDADRSHSMVVVRTVDQSRRLLHRFARSVREVTPADPRRGVRKVIGAVIDDEGVFLVPHGTDVASLSGLLSVDEMATLRSGTGSPIPQVVDAHISYRHGRIALRATRYDFERYGKNAAWSELGLDRVLLQLPLDDLTLADLPDSVQRLLRAGDEALRGTLQVYLDSGADIARTAAALYVHRSTVHYRLDRIHAIVGVDLSDGAVRRELHTAMRTAQLAGLG